MTNHEITILLDTIAVAVHAAGNWREKQTAILAQCTESDKGNLEEFFSWFEEFFNETDTDSE